MKAAAHPRLAWLALVEDHGWTPEKIAHAWSQSVEVVMEALSGASSQPLHQARQVPSLPSTEEKAPQRRDLTRLLYRQGASVEELTQRFCYYSTGPSEDRQAAVRDPQGHRLRQPWLLPLRLRGESRASAAVGQTSLQETHTAEIRDRHSVMFHLTENQALKTYKSGQTAGGLGGRKTPPPTGRTPAGYEGGVEATTVSGA